MLICSMSPRRPSRWFPRKIGDGTGAPDRRRTMPRRSSSSLPGFFPAVAPRGIAATECVSWTSAALGAAGTLDTLCSGVVQVSCRRLIARVLLKIAASTPSICLGRCHAVRIKAARCPCRRSSKYPLDLALHPGDQAAGGGASRGMAAVDAPDRYLQAVQPVLSSALCSRSSTLRTAGRCTMRSFHAV
jgi:hypothetical protein